MAVEPRSESILLTGSGEGEVRVWSLRDNPVSRLSGFRCGESSNNNSGGARHNSSSSPRPTRAVTQLGLFEGGARGVALDGLVRVWDIERSVGMKIMKIDATFLTCGTCCGLSTVIMKAVAPGGVLINLEAINTAGLSFESHPEGDCILVDTARVFIDCCSCRTDPAWKELSVCSRNSSTTDERTLD